MVKITNGPVIKCSNCNKNYSLSENDFNEPEIFSEERKLGSDNHFKWSIDFDCSNSDCSNHLEVSIKGYEYPEGSLSEAGPALELEGCEVIKEPILESLIHE